MTTPSTPGNYFGTYVPPERLPRETFEISFESPDVLAYLYCNKCGNVSELTKEAVVPALQLINLTLGTGHDVDEVDWKQHYILAQKGCLQCGDGTRMVLSLEKVAD